MRKLKLERIKILNVITSKEDTLFTSEGNFTVRN